MKKYALILTFFLVAMFAIFSFGNDTQKKKSIMENRANEGVVVLELFTSQGCSSCPPADEILGKYADQKNPNIIALAFHVDYWNYIGWKDPFSQTEFTTRQNWYAQKFDLKSIYTPQLIVNGTSQIVGSKENDISKLVNQELKKSIPRKITIEISSVSDNTLKVDYSCSNFEDSQAVHLALIRKKSVTNIKRGENVGKKLANYSIVSQFFTQSKKSGQEIFVTDRSFNPQDFEIVAYQQELISGKILCAAKHEIN